MSFVSAIVTDVSIGFSFPFIAVLILQFPTVLRVVGGHLAVGTPFVSIPTTLSSFSVFRLLTVECFRYSVRFGHHCFVVFAFFQGIHDLLDRNTGAGLENFDGN